MRSRFHGNSAAPLIVKIGGSLLREPRLKTVLALVASASRPTVAVPGGGPFADTVRETQATLGFDDITAHRMALLAMDQAGLGLAALQPRLAPVQTRLEISRALTAGSVPLWLPFRLAARDRQIPADWSITSDGLAARLAELLGARDVLLLKACPVREHADLVELTSEGIVDRCFAEIVNRSDLSWRVIGAGEEAVLAAALGAAAPLRRARRSSSTPAPGRARAVVRGGS